MATTIETTPTFNRGRPRALFEGYYQATYMSFDVSSDGNRFVMLKTTPRTSAPEQPTLVLVQNWFEELTRLVPSP